MSNLNATATTRSSGPTRHQLCPNKRHFNDSQNEDCKKNKALGQILVSPREEKSFKRVDLTNGMKVVLISTIKKDVDLRVNEETCTLVAVEEFNKRVIEVDGIVPRPTMPTRTCDYGLFNTSCDFEDLRGIITNCGDQVPQPSNDQNLGIAQKSCTTKCGAILTVGVGSFHDPEDLSGTAHLVEHAYFLGSKKYPEESSFLTYMQRVGGTANAYTEGERTTYHSEVLQKDFDEMLDMMGDMMTNPLMRDESVIREAEAVDCEFAIRKSKDFLRVVHLVNMFASECHPVRKFSCGNKSTLLHNAGNLGPRLRAWKDEFYKARQMSLIIYGPYDFDELEAKAQRHFGEIPPGCSPTPLGSLVKSNKAPFENCTAFNAFYLVTPVTDVKILTITWALPPSIWQNFETKPITYASYLFNHRGQGGIFHLLRNQGLITNLYGGSMFNNVFQNQFVSAFGIGVELTPKGTECITQIIEKIFAYLQFLRAVPSCEIKAIFFDLAHLYAKSFHYMVPKATSKAVGEVLGKNIHNPLITDENLLVSTQLLTKLDSQAIKQFLDLLQPQSANFLLLNRDHASKCSKKEQFHQAPYCEVCVPAKVLKGWANPKVKYLFSLFPSNEYIPHGNLCLTNGPKMSGVRRHIEKSKLSLLYINSPCSVGAVSEAAYSLTFMSPVLSGMGAKVNALFVLMSQIMNDELQMKAPDAFAAGITCKWFTGHGNIVCYSGGDSYKLDKLLLTALDIFKNVEFIDQVHYENMRIYTLVTVKNALMDNITYAKDITNKVTLYTYNTLIEIADALEDTPFSAYQSFVKSFKERMFVQGTLLGAVPEIHFEKIIAALRELNFQPVCPAELEVHRANALPFGEKCIRVNSKNPEDNTSVISNYYYLGLLEENDIKIAQDIAKMIPRELFVQLRTKEQIGYHVQATLTDSFKAYGISVIVKCQSDKFSTSYVNKRIDKFMDEFYQQKLCSGTHPVHSEFFKKYFLRTGCEFRKLTVQVVAPQVSYNNSPRCCNSDETNANRPRGTLPNNGVSLTLNDMELGVGMDLVRKSPQADFLMHPRPSEYKDQNVTGLEYNYSSQDLRGFQKTNEYYISDIELFKRGLFSCPNETSNVTVRIVTDIDQI